MLNTYVLLLPLSPL